MPWIMPGRVGPPARVACVDDDEQLPRALPTEAVHEIAVTTRRGCCYDAGCEDGWGCDVSSAAAGAARVEAEAGGPDCGDAYAELVPWAEVNGDGWITGPNSDRERCGSLACCPFCFLLPWPFFGVSTLLEEWVVWTRWVDLSTPVEFRFGGGVLEVKSRRNVVCWHREVIPEEAVERVGVFVTPTRWVSRTVAGGGTWDNPCLATCGAKPVVDADCGNGYTAPAFKQGAACASSVCDVGGPTAVDQETCCAGAPTPAPMRAPPKKKNDFFASPLKKWTIAKKLDFNIGFLQFLVGF